MQARGGLRGIDIEKELLSIRGEGDATTLPPMPDDAQYEELLREQQAKNWKAKRERPPLDIDAQLSSPPAGGAGVSVGGTASVGGPSATPGSTSTYEHRPPVRNMAKYNQEITYWNYIQDRVLSNLQNGRPENGVRLNSALQNDTMRILLCAVC
jgi:hypothetical protein